MGKQIARFALSPISAVVSLFDKNAGAFLFNAIATAAAFIPGAGPLISAGMQAVNAATGAYRFSRNGGGGGLPDLGRLSLSQVAAAPRKAVFGTTALAADVRYIEPSGTDQEYVDAIVHLASHKITSLDEIRIDDKVAWTSGGGVTGDATGYLTVSVITEGGAGAFHTVNAGTTWGSAQRLTGCASVKLRFKRSGNSKKAQSPYAAGVPGKIVFIGKGMPVYDPRRDSTVPGGSGAHRANNRSTWAFTDGGTDLGNNPALQALSWLLGWTIGGKVSVGLGLPAARLDLAAFATAANICDETVTLAAGGSQRRYDGAGLFSDADDPANVMQAFAAAVNGWWDDSSGKLGLFCAINDLAGATFTLTADDVLGPVQWEPFPEIAEQYNIVRGLNPDPALPANYQPTDYPEVKITSADGIDRALQVNYGMVQNKIRAQRLAKQVLQRQQYRGVARLTVGVRGWQLVRGQPIKFTFAPIGWVDKLFRVEEWGLDPSGDVALTLREENAAVYAWDEDETAPVVPATPVTYNPLNNPFLIANGVDIGVDNGATRNIPRGDWATATAYAVGDFVNDGGNAYTCIVAHTSGAGNRPPSANWSLLVTGGGAGAAGDNVAIVRIYKRSATSPAGPTGSAVFDFNGTLTESTVGALNGWTQAIPAADGNPAWERLAGARNGGASDTITSGEWSAAVKVLQDGEAPRLIYQRSATAPSAPAASAGTPSGWYATTDTVPSGANPIWVSTGTRPDPSSNYTWQAPTRFEAVTLAAFGQQVALGFSVSAPIAVVLSPGQTASVEAQLTGSHTGTATIDIGLEYRVEGGTWTAFGTSTPDSGGAGDITVATASGTFTNSGATGSRYEIRATGTRTAANVTAVSAESYLRA